MEQIKAVMAKTVSVWESCRGYAVPESGPDRATFLYVYSLAGLAVDGCRAAITISEGRGAQPFMASVARGCVEAAIQARWIGRDHARVESILAEGARTRALTVESLSELDPRHAHLAQKARADHDARVSDGAVGPPPLEQMANRVGVPMLREYYRFTSNVAHPGLITSAMHHKRVGDRDHLLSRPFWNLTPQMMDASLVATLITLSALNELDAHRTLDQALSELHRALTRLGNERFAPHGTNRSAPPFSGAEEPDAQP